MVGFAQQLWDRPEIELQPKVDPSVGGERAVSARVVVPGAHRSAKKGAVQVPGLGLKMRGVAGPVNQDAA